MCLQVSSAFHSYTSLPGAWGLEDLLSLGAGEWPAVTEQIALVCYGTEIHHELPS